MFTSTSRLILLWMATGSPPDAWALAVNATSASYRNFKEHLERWFPALVSNGIHIARVRWGQKPHRKANQLGKEFSATPDPDQINALDVRIKQTETAFFSKVTEYASPIPIVTHYMLLTREQEWQQWTDDTTTPSQCPVLVAPPVSPLWIDENDRAIILSPRAPGLGNFSVWAKSAVRKWRSACFYGLPVGLGVVTGMVWNRREVLASPFFFSIMFAGWTWNSGQPESISAFLEQLRQNAKSFRSTISMVLMFVANSWTVIQFVVCFQELWWCLGKFPGG